MIETPHTIDRETGIPVFSLYSETREPTEEMLENVDAIVFDMQDVGCRIYTFIYTMANCMRAAKKFGKKVVVCDRPNPINGTGVEGNMLEEDFASFVGQFPMPTRHGMTCGELALMFNDHYGIGCDLEVVKMGGWERDFWFEQTGLPFVMPSPNIPHVDTCVIFPGTVHIEGTEVSEGRGTTKPFELIGAPYIDPVVYKRELDKLDLPGVAFRATSFQPTFQKFGRVTSGGVQIHMTNREALLPVTTGVAVMKVAFDLYPDDFQWKQTAYEYVFDVNPIDVVAGTDKLRKQLENGESVDNIQASWKDGEAEFRTLREKYLLY
jgi:uncharacterized protein YbbC (DUF1343 family)